MVPALIVRALASAGSQIDLGFFLGLLTYEILIDFFTYQPWATITSSSRIINLD
jgi:hypothetical protein